MSDKRGLLSFLNFDSIVENLSGYIEKRISLFKIELKEELSQGAARILILIILSLCLFMVLLFLSIAAAMLLNKLFGSNSFGFILVAAFYLVIFLLVFILKDKTKLESRVQKKFLDIFDSLDEENGNN